MRGRVLLLTGWVLLISPAALFAAALDEATALKTEAMGILQGASDSSTDPKTYASALIKLEKAQQILEKANAGESPVAQEVSTALFWARKFANIQSMNEADKMRQGVGSPVASNNRPKPPTPRPPARPTEPTKAEPPAMPGMGGADKAKLTEAKKKFQAAERFAQTQKADDYIVALRWFQTADQLSGTDYAVKALANARAAQERHAAKVAEAKAAKTAEPALKGPEYDLIREADALLAKDQYEDALKKYRESYSRKDNILAHRKLAHALFDRAQVIKDSLMPQFEEAQRAYQEAYKAATREIRTSKGLRYWRTNWNDPRLVTAKRNGQKLMAEARVAIRQYDRAYVEFSRVLNMAEGMKDLDAAAHQALCYSVRGDALSRGKAKSLLVRFLNDYQPQNDMERTTYEFCKTELKRISSER